MNDAALSIYFAGKSDEQVFAELEGDLDARLSGARQAEELVVVRDNGYVHGRVGDNGLGNATAPHVPV